MGNGDGFINPGESTSISFNLLNNTGSDFSDLNIQIKSSNNMILSENIFTVEQLNQSESIIIEDLILNVPANILPDNEPIFYINISGNNSSYESNQLLDLEIYSGTVSLHAEGNFSPGIITDFNIFL